MRLTLIAIVMLFVICPVWGQTCSNPIIRGTYGLVCTGYITPAQGAPQAPFSAIGTVVGDANGVFTGNATASIAGAIVSQAVTGSVVWNGDCTGTITYTQTINGQKAPNVNITFHVLDQGKEIRGMATDAGSTMTCNLRLMSR